MVVTNRIVIDGRNNIINLLILIYLHFLADFVLQDDFQAKLKGQYKYILFVHSFLWAGTISIGLYYLGMFAMWKFAMLLVGHFIIDRWKIKKEDKTNALTWDLWKDQMLHVGQLLICLV